MPGDISISSIKTLKSDFHVFYQDHQRYITTYKHIDGLEGWDSADAIIGPLRLGALASVIQWNSGSVEYLRLYYQADDGSIRELSKDDDGSWEVGDFIGKGRQVEGSE